MEEPNIGERRITIFLLLALTAIVAVLVATNLVGAALAVLFFVLLPSLVFGAIVHSVYWLQMFAASRFTSFFYSRGMFRLIRLTCGREYSAWALNNYATKLFTLEQYEASNDAFTRVIQLDKRSADYWAHRGASRYSMGDYQNAIDDLSTALDLENNHQIASTYRGYALIAIEEFPAALEDLAQVECDTSEHYMIAYYRGHLHEILHHWKRAFDDYFLAYNLDATQTGAGISLARLQAGCPDENLRDAGKAIENATNMCIRTAWNDWVAVSVLGAAYSEAADFDNAIKYAKIAFDLAPDHEKPERANRLTQFRNQQPFRIPSTDPNTGQNVQNAT